MTTIMSSTTTTTGPQLYKIEYHDPAAESPSMNFRHIFYRLNAALDAVHEAGGCIVEAGDKDAMQDGDAIFVEMPEGKAMPVDPAEEDWNDFVVTKVQ